MWGDGGEGLDWALAAERLATTVLSICPRWVIFVEGVGAPEAPSQYWWGEYAQRMHTHSAPVPPPVKGGVEATCRC
jgi:hypothetical protein